MTDLRQKIQKAIEDMPYPYVAGTCGDDGEDIPETLRSFYEGTWQGEHADDLFSSVTAVAIAAVLNALNEPSEAMTEAGADVPASDHWEADVPSIWQAMLAAFREEQGV